MTKMLIAAKSIPMIRRYVRLFFIQVASPKATARPSSQDSSELMPSNNLLPAGQSTPR